MARPHHSRQGGRTARDSTHSIFLITTGRSTPSESVGVQQPTAADGKLAEPRIAHTKAFATAGLPHVSLYGPRRSFCTLCEWVEMPSGISAQIMGHKPSTSAEKHYRHRQLDLLRKWHDLIESWILEQPGIDFVPAAPGLRVVGGA